jgi:hypothetical protein
MQLNRTSSDIPYIDLTDGINDYGQLIFSNSTKTAAGFKYICFSRRYDDVVVISKGKGKNKRHDTMTTSKMDSYVFNMRFKRDAAGRKGVPNGMLPRPLVKWLIDTFEPFLNEDGVFPFNRIDELAEIIEAANINALVETSAEKAKRKRREKKMKKEIKKELNLSELF